MRATAAIVASVALLLVSPAARAEAVSVASIPEAHIPAPAKSLDGAPLYGKPVEGLELGGKDGARAWANTEDSKAPACIEVEASGPTRMLSATSDTEIGNKPFRLERFAQAKDGSVHLEIIDAWLDATIDKPRTIRVTPVALAKVAEGPAGLTLYAYREGKHVVFVSPTRGASTFREADPAGGVEGVPITFSECGFTRIQVDTSAKTGSSGMAFGLTPRPWPAAPTPKGKGEPTQVWVSVSSSRVSRDPAPLLAISMRTFAR